MEKNKGPLFPGCWTLGIGTILILGVLGLALWIFPGIRNQIIGLMVIVAVVAIKTFWKNLWI